MWIIVRVSLDYMVPFLMKQVNSSEDVGILSCPVCGSPARYDFSGRDLMFDLHHPYHYYGCTKCHVAFQHPIPDMATIATFYPSSYGIYDENTRFRKLSSLRRAILHHARGYRHLTVSWGARVLAAVVAPFMRSDTPHFVPGGTILDVGCGNGRYMNTMRSLGWQVQGVELSEDGVRACRLADLSVHHGDLVSAHFADASFDLITARHILEHVPEPHRFFAELARILKPTGTLVIETPNAEALGRAWFGANWYANDVPRHLILFSPSSLEFLAANHGLECTDISQQTTPKIVLNSIDYAIGTRGRPSKKVRWRRLLARFYVRSAERHERGDTLHARLRKP